MQITFKTLQQKTFKLEIDEAEKIKVLKEKIAAEKGEEFPVAGQKLIYAGKILEDDKTISECAIDDKNFIVVMVVKQKAKPAADKPKETSSSSSSSSSATASSVAAPESMSVDTPTTTTTSSASAAESTTTTTSQSETTTPSSTPSVLPQASSAESTLLTGTELESAITELMSLGYPREQVMRALNASFHNADRAADYLLSGHIPEMPPDEGDVGDIGAGGDDVGSGGGGGGGGAPTNDLSFLRDLPQFQQMRDELQRNPQNLPQLLQQIGQSNPQLLSLISQNQEQFISILNNSAAGGGAGGGGGGGGEAQLGGAGGGAGAPFQIQVTQSEKAQIDRIVGMGFPEAEVIQAFFACDKNEQLAIDFLLKD